MKWSSDLKTSRSSSQDCREGFPPGSPSTSCVVPLLPAVWESRDCGVSAEDAGNGASEEGNGVAIGEELDDAFEGHDPSDGLDAKPEITHRRRMFHTV